MLMSPEITPGARARYFTSKRKNMYVKNVEPASHPKQATIGHTGPGSHGARPWSGPAAAAASSSSDLSPKRCRDSDMLFVSQHDRYSFRQNDIGKSTEMQTEARSVCRIKTALFSIWAFVAVTFLVNSCADWCQCNRNGIGRKLVKPYNYHVIGGWHIHMSPWNKWQIDMPES